MSTLPVTTAKQLSHAPNLPHTVVCGAHCSSSQAAMQQHAGLGEQVRDFFGGIFSTSNWPARWHCGNWSDFHGWLYIISDLIIWGAYFAIPFLLARMVTRRADIPFPRIVWLFVAFIILCGTTHLLDAIIFWWPAYRLSALIRLTTAIVSLLSLYALYKVMPLIMSLRTVSDLEREITERKAVEEKLADSEFLLNEAGRIGRMGGWEFDIVQQKSRWSKMIYEIYDVPPDYDIDRSDAYNFFPEPYKQQLQEAVTNAYKEGDNWDLELQMITGKGNTIWVRSVGECCYDDKGKMVKLRGVFMNIDRYKKNELEVNKSHELLFHSHQQLKTFTHILSHNIRNHASNISLLSGLINANTLDEENLELFDKIGKVSNGLNDTLNDLATAIKIRENKVESEKLSFREITGNVVEVLESEILMNGVQIKYQFNIPDIIYPKLYLESIIMNLVSNAIKYRKPDVPPVVQLKTYRNGTEHTVFECTDNGLGIDLKLHGERVFGLYKTFHEHKEAHGVGLFLVKTQVEAQGGMVQVESEPGIGTTFRIVF